MHLRTIITSDHGSQAILNTLIFVCLSFFAGVAGAQQPSLDAAGGAGDAQPVVKGQRVATCAHSFHAFVYPLLAEAARNAGIQGHENVGYSLIGGSRVIRHWDVADDKNEVKRALRAGGVDVLTLSPIWMPDEGIEKFATLGLEHNPDIRVTVQKFWLPNDTYEPVYPLDVRKTPRVDHDATNLAELREKQARYDHDVEEFVLGINKRLGRDVIVTVPVGMAVLALREKIASGKAPGLTKQWDLFRDPWGHPQVPIQLLSAYCHFAVIYHKSPVGLPVPEALEKMKISAGDKKSLNLLLQELAWDTVKNHPPGGASSAE